MRILTVVRRLRGICYKNDRISFLSDTARTILTIQLTGWQMVYDSILLTLCTKISVMSISRFGMGINTIVRVAAVAILCCISLTAAEAKTEAQTETNVVAATVANSCFDNGLFYSIQISTFLYLC